MNDLMGYLRGRGPGGRSGQLAIVVYVALSAASVAWGLSGGTRPDNDLAAQVRWEASEFPTLIMTNLSGDEWTSVRAELDGRYYVDVARVPRGHSVAMSATEFRDGYLVPRPDGMFGYERTISRAPLPERVLPPDYAPREVRIVADQGEAITTLASP